jgi:cytochrome c biogenesis protein CcdA
MVSQEYSIDMKALSETIWAFFAAGVLFLMGMLGLLFEPLFQIIYLWWRQQPYLSGSVIITIACVLWMCIAAKKKRWGMFFSAMFACYGMLVIYNLWIMAR